MGAQVVLSSILLVKGKGVRKRALIKQINNWLWNCSRRQVFGSYNHGTLFQSSVCSEEVGVHLTKQGKVTFASRMADLLRSALN